MHFATLALACVQLCAIFTKSTHALDVHHPRAIAAAPAAATVTNATRATLDRIIRTYEWDQYRYQAASCLNTPSLGVDCTHFTYGYGIPSLDVVQYDIQDWGATGGVDYGYLYTIVSFNGFGRTNYTSLEPAFINITAQAMYFSCQANATCAKAYNSTAGIQTSLHNLVAENSGVIKAMLPANNSMTWIPKGNSNFLSYFTTFPDPDDEIFGLHNSVLYASQNLTQAQITAMYSLRVRLSGGAEMYENLMTTLALGSLDTASNSTTYKRRDVPASAPERGIVGGIEAFTALRTKRLALLDKLVGLRGADRAVVSQLNMANNYQVLGFNPTPSLFDDSLLLQRRGTCADALQVAANLQSVTNFISSACGLSAPFRHVMSFPGLATSFGNAPFWKAAVGLGTMTNFFFNHFVAQLSFVDALCRQVSNNAPCFPDSNFWVSTANKQSLLSSLIEDAFDVTALVAGGEALIPLKLINIGCDVVDLANQTYTAARACCGLDCSSPACTAGSIGCVVAGPGC